MQKYKRESENFIELPSPGPRLLFSGLHFMMGLGKTQLLARFEVASVSRCINITGDPKILGSFPSPGPIPLFFCMLFHDGPCKNPSCLPYLKSLASAVAEILKKSPKYQGALLVQVHAHFFLGGILWLDLPNPSSCQFWSRQLWPLQKY